MSKRVSGVKAIHLGDTPRTGNPRNNPSAWTALGKVLDGHESDLETGSVEDGKGAPVSTDATLDKEFQLIDMNSFDEVRTKETARTRQDVAEELLNGDFRVYRNCKVFVDYNPNPGKGKIQTLMFEFVTGKDKWSFIRDIQGAFAFSKIFNVNVVRDITLVAV